MREKDLLPRESDIKVQYRPSYSQPAERRDRRKPSLKHDAGGWHVKKKSPLSTLPPLLEILLLLLFPLLASWSFIAPLNISSVQSLCSVGLSLHRLRKAAGRESSLPCHVSLPPLLRPDCLLGAVSVQCLVEKPRFICFFGSPTCRYFRIQRPRAGSIAAGLLPCLYAVLQLRSSSSSSSISSTSKTMNSRSWQTRKTR